MVNKKEAEMPAPFVNSISFVTHGCLALYDGGIGNRTRDACA
jgi:hypothetical protein